MTDGREAWPMTAPPHPAAADRREAWPAAAPPHAGGPMRQSSGLFPGPSRPTYREAHPVTAAPLLAGLGAGVIWLALFGALARDLAGYAWWTLLAAVTAWIVAVVLTLIGDRGTAVGVALASGVGLSIAVAFVAAEWITTENWPLW
ncbi:hypothetical protein Aab01nite_59110 [Paractinoplanes abujensis]|nr:hypothetical protein Aab01nite_59110 [Actinoplanes abujensis]